MALSKTWLNEAVIYQILIDRFARGGNQPWLNSNANEVVFCGGNLQGIIDKLDYLKDLGVNTLLLTPFHPTTAYHGYHVKDLFGVDERFGSKVILKTLIEQAHAKGMHVMMDFVMAHVSAQHEYFLDARVNPNSKYRDWFQFNTWPDDYVSFLNIYELPKWNLDNAEVREHIFAVVDYWLDFGFDGLRLDHIIGIPNKFLKDFFVHVKSRHSQAVIVGEAVQGKIRRQDVNTLRLKHKWFLYFIGQIHLNVIFFVQLQYRSLMDGLLDFYFRDLIMSFYLRPAWYKPYWLMKPLLALHQKLYPKHFGLISLLDDADDDRFLFFLNNDQYKYKQILTAQFTRQQPVFLYYGNEVGVKQIESRQFATFGDKPHGDLAARGLMKWENIDQELLEFFKTALRKHRS